MGKLLEHSLLTHSRASSRWGWDRQARNLLLQTFEHFLEVRNLRLGLGTSLLHGGHAAAVEQRAHDARVAEVEHSALDACGAHLVSHGGHAMAAGFKVRPENYAAFRAAFWDYCAARYGGPPPPPPLVVEAEARVEQLSLEMVRDLAKLEPHGAGNPRPFFLLRGCRVERAKLIGERQDHLSMTVSHPGPKANQIRCVGFGMGERVEEVKGFVDVIGVPKINEWMGRKSVEMELKDFRPTPATR